MGQAWNCRDAVCRDLEAREAPTASAYVVLVGKQMGSRSEQGITVMTGTQARVVVLEKKTCLARASTFLGMLSMDVWRCVVG